MLLPEYLFPMATTSIMFRVQLPRAKASTSAEIDFKRGEAFQPELGDDHPPMRGRDRKPHGILMLALLAQMDHGDD